MRRFADYSIPNGDRDGEEILLDDDGEFEPVEKSLMIKSVDKSSKKNVNINLVEIKIPRAFDFDYYSNKIEEAKAKLDKSQAYRIQAFKKYAEAVYQFYRQVTFLSNKTNNIIQMPEYVKLCEKISCDVDDLANVLYSKEQDLLKAYNMNDGKLNTAITKSKHYTEVKEFASLAWMTYYSLKSLNNYVGYLRYIQDCYLSADLTKPSHMANIYGLHIQAEYYTNANIKNFFSINQKGIFAKKRPLSMNLYQNVNSVRCFEYLVENNNGYLPHKHPEVEELKNKILDGTTEKRIIGFYDHYVDMKYVKHKLRKIAKLKPEDLNQNPYLFLDEFNNDERLKNRDLYIQGGNYYRACESLLEEIPTKSKISKDVKDMYNDLSDVLIAVEDYYRKFKELDKKMDAKFNEFLKK